MSHINTGENMMAGGKKWCVTDGMCGSSLGDGQFFDTCAIPTTRGCSCRRDWMTKGSPVDGYVTLQYAATRCNTLQYAATFCNMLQHAATCGYI